ncbi:hypothetical protein J6590_039246 [Homalodisca vitripennis]|nr:hypothetical protein J6590_039246 [Homalodisca vitripennis]
MLECGIQDINRAVNQEMEIDDEAVNCTGSELYWEVMLECGIQDINRAVMLECGIQDINRSVNQEMKIDDEAVNCGELYWEVMLECGIQDINRAVNQEMEIDDEAVMLECGIQDINRAVNQEMENDVEAVNCTGSYNLILIINAVQTYLTAWPENTIRCINTVCFHFTPAAQHVSELVKKQPSCSVDRSRSAIWPNVASPNRHVSASRNMAGAQLAQYKARYLRYRLLYRVRTTSYVSYHANN